MNKFGALLILIGGVVFAYIILTAAQGAIVNIVSTANTTMAETSNMSNYPGAQQGLLAMPLVLYFIPAIIGIAGVVYVLKFKK